MRITTLGVFQLYVRDAAVNLPARAGALLSYLCALFPRSQSRDSLVDLLWDNKDVNRKRHSLTQLLYTLRIRAPAVIISYGDKLALDPNLECDLWTFRSAMAKRDFSTAIESYSGAFLEDFPFITPDFDDWCVETRASLHNEFTVIARRRLLESVTTDSPTSALAEADKLATLIPFDAHIARLRIEALARAGYVDEALIELAISRERIERHTGEAPSQLSDTFAEHLSAISSTPSSTEGRFTLPFVGRNNQLHELTASLSESRNGARRVVIRGEPGVGKTRLLHQFLRIAAIEGCKVYTHKCAQIEAHLPYSGLVHLLQDGFDNSAYEAMHPKWRQALAIIAPEISAAEPAMHVNQRMIWESVVQYFVHATKDHSIVVSIDDYQWLDADSRDVMEYLHSRLRDAPILSVLCGRGGRTGISSIHNEGSVLVDVPELPPEHVEQLINGYEAASGFQVPSVVRQAVNERVGGRPFFILQALQHVSAQDSFVDPSILLPPNVAAYSTNLIGGLGHGARRIAAAVAVIGRAIPAAVLQRITDLPPESIAHALDEMIESGVLAEGAGVRFTHDLFKDSILQSLSSSQKAWWHARIAECLGIAQGTASEIAFHFEEGGLPDSAAQCAGMAVQDALRVHAYAEADAQYKRLIRCSAGSERDSHRADYVKFLGRVGRYSDLANELEWAESYYAATTDPEGLLLCAICRFGIDRQASGTMPSGLLPQAKQILELARLQSPASLAAAVWTVSECLRLAADRSTMQEFVTILQDASTDSTSATSGELLSAAAVLAALSEGYDAGLLLAERANSAAELSQDVVALAKALFARATTLLWGGRLDEAAQDYYKALDVGDGYILPDMLQAIIANLAIVDLERGDAAKARRHAESALSNLAPASAAFSRANLVIIELQDNNIELAKRHALDLRDSVASSQQSWIRRDATALLGLVTLHEGDIQSARALYASMLGQLKDDPSMDNSYPHIFLSKMARLETRYDEARYWLQRGRESVARIDRLGLLRIEVETSALLFATGNTREALNLARSIIDQSKALGALTICLSAQRELDSMVDSDPTR